MSLREIKLYPASVQVNCIDSTFQAEAEFQSEAKKLQQVQFKPGEQVTFGAVLSVPMHVLWAVTACQRNKKLQAA
ncbi:unnamed protein product [Brassica napus]|uniref:(rape) hypothetical protein n=1 Tax=Brassica napus TaxID=3708 RepID=A0A817B586_BRANA|nr:unnamed protein product [Brassica napus]